MDAVQKLTQFDASRNIVRSGAAMGTSRNINRATDILMMLMLQSGVRMTDDENAQASFSRSVDGQPVGERSLQFYTDFANPQQQVYTWNDTQDYSVDAFAAGKTAMMLNYSHQIPVIRAKAPRLNWGVDFAPQASVSFARTYANYWPFTVALRSQHPYEAWRFVHYVTADVGNVSYLNASGRPAARRDLIAQQKLEPEIGVFAEQALTARSWFQINNQAIETIFSDMIDAVNLGRQTVRDALREAEAKVSVLMSR
jgi:ABC-type glycerol-3-phosphate transport system substrate-binding protein